VAFSENTLELAGLASTRMLCDRARNEQENKVTQALEHTTVLVYDEEAGKLTIGSGENTLIFKKQ
jgi:heat shock protein HslJ